MEARIIWFPGHRGLNLNKLADGLANLARTYGRTKIHGYTKEEAFGNIKEKIWDEWQDDFSHPERRFFFYKAFPIIYRKPWLHKNNLKSSEVKILKLNLTSG